MTFFLLTIFLFMYLIICLFWGKKQEWAPLGQIEEDGETGDCGREEFFWKKNLIGGQV